MNSTFVFGVGFMPAKRLAISILDLAPSFKGVLAVAVRAEADGGAVAVFPGLEFIAPEDQADVEIRAGRTGL